MGLDFIVLPHQRRAHLARRARTREPGGLPPPLSAGRAKQDCFRHQRLRRVQLRVQRVHTLLRDLWLVSPAQQASFPPHTTATVSQTVSCVRPGDIPILPVPLHAPRAGWASTRLSWEPMTPTRVRIAAQARMQLVLATASRKTAYGVQRENTLQNKGHPRSQHVFRVLQENTRPVLGMTLRMTVSSAALESMFQCPGAMLKPTAPHVVQGNTRRLWEPQAQKHASCARQASILPQKATQKKETVWIVGPALIPLMLARPM